MSFDLDWRAILDPKMWIYAVAGAAGLLLSAYVYQHAPIQGQAPFIIYLASTCVFWISWQLPTRMADLVLLIYELAQNTRSQKNRQR